MPINTIFYITLAVIIALGFVFFTYFFRSKNTSKQTYFLATARFFTVLILLLLLINPEIKQVEFEVEKPNLILAVDNSESIDNLKKSDSVNAFVHSLKTDKDLAERFNIVDFSFGEKLKQYTLGKYEFNENKTNIHNALSQLNKLFKKSIPTALIMLSDGNATYGQDYEFLKAKENINILPVLVGDTTTALDLSISALNVNKYAFLNNKFPVEIVLNYSGTKPIKGNFKLRTGNTTLFSKTLDLSKEHSSEVLTTTLLASKIGTLIYEASLTSSENEKNIFNNKRKFAVEVIDEKSKILLVSDISHPDLGALKKSIEKNEQREVKLIDIDNLIITEINDYQLVVIYQPNNKFNKLFNLLDTQNINKFIITGTQTDWNFLNSIQQNFSKSVSNQIQDLFPIYNENFLQYQFEDFGFKNMPPLEAAFGNLKIDGKDYNTLLYQKLEGINTSQPLLSIFQENTIKTGVLFGENIWKWRPENFRLTQSFEKFDEFISKLVQYLSSNKKRDRLTFESEPIYLENDRIIISAQYFDENYVFDANGRLNIFLKNTTSEKSFEAQMLPNSNFYKIEMDGLAPGEYQFSIKEENSKIQKNGSFSVLEFNVEQQYSSANFTKMDFLARNNLGNLYFLSERQRLIDKLLEDKRFVSIQKSDEKTVPLIDWKYLLTLLVLSLSIEWFTRKYFGLI